jgi:hypothetical protein
MVRIVIRIAEVAPAAGLCELTQTVEYGKVHLEGGDFLLPKQVLTQLTKSDGAQFENRATYSNWRGFPSSIPAAEGPSPTSTLSAERPPPPGIRFSIMLDQPIDTATAAFGDRVRAIVTSDAVDNKSGRVAFPAGAVVEGRIIKLLRVYGRTESSYSLTILVRWETVTDEKSTRRFTARLEELLRVGVGAFSGIDGAALKEADGFSLRTTDRGLSEVRGVKPGHILRKGMRTRWKTVAP